MIVVSLALQRPGGVESVARKEPLKDSGTN